MVRLELGKGGFVCYVQVHAFQKILPPSQTFLRCALCGTTWPTHLQFAALKIQQEIATWTVLNAPEFQDYEQV